MGHRRIPGRRSRTSTTARSRWSTSARSPPRSGAAGRAGGAVARGRLLLRERTIDAIRADAVEKGDVLATARVGAIQAVKHAWESIPLCHQIPITNVDTAFDVDDANDAVTLTVAVETTAQTGCEMEALEGVSTGLNVVFDMVKAIEKDDDGEYPTAAIEDVRVVEKAKQPVGE
jgi:cyclic pyranopterin phosphate synthase